ncbi:MAG: hypothetical protein N2504_03300 [candidate division WOR-3 bacterium]|nr:hypothetical protein [candidate division WOR-3 bacterium]MCX7947597.1 hypothetical protein [candidate division WOR-3 bacterium]MDW8150482.1 hypothetical protein [candidate division WOR-3 bacterium]
MVAWIDTIYLFSHGDGQWYGQNNYPYIVYNNPPTSATPTNPSLDVLSLGKFGFIMLGFKNKFTLSEIRTFENVFIYSTNPDTQVFAEPGILYYSKNGKLFFQYSFDTSNSNIYYWKGLSGIKPTNYGANVNDPNIWMGDKFLFNDTVRFIIIADWISKCKHNLCSGYDLDAVACLNCQTSNYNYIMPSIIYAVGTNGDTINWEHKVSFVDGNCLNIGENGVLIFRSLNIINKQGIDFKIVSNKPVRIYGGDGRLNFINAFYYNTRPDTLGEIDSLKSRSISSPFGVSDTVRILAIRSDENTCVDGIEVFNVKLEEKIVENENVEIFTIDGKRIFYGNYKDFKNRGVFIVRQNKLIKKEVRR